MKIGVFDSGFGGLSILKGFLETLPNYNYVYIGDNARAPYGNKSFDTVYQYTLQAVKKLFSLDCQLVILACNTASAKALRSIQQNDLPKIDSKKRVLGIIRPSVEVIKNYTTSQNIGVLGTIGTVNSNSYPLEIHKLFPEIKVYQQACPMWATLVETGEYQNQGADFFIQKDISDLLNQSKEIDAIILACTHYPLMINKIRQFIPQNINIITQNQIVANSLKDYLFRHKEIDNLLDKNPNVEYYTTDNPKNFEEMAKIFLGKEIVCKQINL